MYFNIANGFMYLIIMRESDIKNLNIDLFK